MIDSCQSKVLLQWNAGGNQEHPVGTLIFLQHPPRHAVPDRCQVVICFPVFFFFSLKQNIPIIRMNSLLSPLEFGGKILLHHVEVVVVKKPI